MTGIRLRRHDLVTVPVDRARPNLHRFGLSLFPNWVGSEQVRFVEVAGDELTITTRPLRIGGETVNRLVWERAE